MTQAGVSPNSIARPSLWHTPVPYLFTGIGAMLFLIAVALVVLACSRKKRPRSDVESSIPEMHNFGTNIMSPVDREPPIFVLVPGKSLPSFLAKPVVANNELNEPPV